MLNRTDASALTRITFSGATIIILLIFGFLMAVTQKLSVTLNEKNVNFINENFEFLNSEFEISVSENDTSDFLLSFENSQMEKSEFIAFTPLIMLQNEESGKRFEKVLTSDLSMLIGAVLNQKDWTHVEGGKAMDIRIYCPPLDTFEGALFKEFVTLVLSKGADSNEEVLKDVDDFFNSPNVFQVDVVEKLSKVQGGEIPDEDIYFLFESDAIPLCIGDNSIKGEWIMYPERTVVKNVYLHVNKEEEKEDIVSEVKDSFYYNCYRTSRGMYGMYNGYGIPSMIKQNVNTFY